MSEFIPNKIGVMLLAIVSRLQYHLEIIVYGKTYKRLEYLYSKGLFDEARQLIDSLEQGTIRTRLAIDSRMQEYLSKDSNHE